MKYLGYLISDKKQQIYKVNFIPLLNNMKADLIKWHNILKNLTDKINLFRMAWIFIFGNINYHRHSFEKYTRL